MCLRACVHRRWNFQEESERASERASERERESVRARACVSSIDMYNNDVGKKSAINL